MDSVYKRRSHPIKIFLHFHLDTTPIRADNFAASSGMVSKDPFIFYIGPRQATQKRSRIPLAEADLSRNGLRTSAEQENGHRDPNVNETNQYSALDDVAENGTREDAVGNKDAECQV